MSGWNDRFVVDESKKGNAPLQKRLPKVPKLKAMNGSVIQSVLRTRMPAVAGRQNNANSKPKCIRRSAVAEASDRSPRRGRLMSPALRKETSAPVMPTKPATDMHPLAGGWPAARTSVSHGGIEIKDISANRAAMLGAAVEASPQPLFVDVGAASPESPCASLGEVSLGDDDEIFDDSSKPFPLSRLMKIGRGSSSTVFKTVMFPSLQVVAEKVVTITERDKRKQLVRELKYLRSLLGEGSTQHCAHIVSLLDAFNNPRDGTVSICLEYMDSGSLQDIVRVGGCKSESVLARISYQVICGLRFLHEHRQVHRDIKPGEPLTSRMLDLFSSVPQPIF